MRARVRASKRGFSIMVYTNTFTTDTSNMRSNCVIMCNSCTDAHDATYKCIHIRWQAYGTGFALPEILHSCGACTPMDVYMYIPTRLFGSMFFLHKFSVSVHYMQSLAILHYLHGYRYILTFNSKRICIQAPGAKRRS